MDNQRPDGRANMHEAVMESGDSVTLKIDLNSGTAEISASAEHFADAAKQAKDILALKSWGPATGSAQTQNPGNLAPETPRAPQVLVPEKAEPSAPRRTMKSAGSSSGRSGRIGAFEPVDFALSEDVERALLGEYQAKKPSSQPDKVVLAMYLGEKLMARRGLSYNEIYSVMRLGGEKDLPKAIDVIISALRKDNWVTSEEDGFALKFLARDHVEKNLPPLQA